jgi:hypothetical protein
MSDLSAARIDDGEFFQVLSNIHRHSKLLQNKPPQFVPKEDLVANEGLFMSCFASICASH